MTLWILDTDITSLLLTRHPIVSQRVIAAGQDVALSIITVQEIFNGWVSRINATDKPDELIHLYGRLERMITLCKKVPILGFDQTAVARLDRIISLNPNLGKKRVQKDMRIASIVLANNAILVTRNTRDFQPVPDLSIENWSIWPLILHP